jgi:protein arginine kinase activator
MLCESCKKNQATKTYEQIKKGKRDVSYYCLECYHKIFLDIDERENGEKSTVCPYCGTTAAELKKRNLVGCAKCYETLQNHLLPVITKMQGSQAHTGKKPYETDTEKLARRRQELTAISEKYKKEKDYESARAYDERRIQLENGLEEDYVWRNRLHLSKQS